MAMDTRMAADPAQDDMLILVDGLDREIGSATKMQAHVDGLLHRAFSVILVRPGVDGPEILLSRRAMGKYHSGGLWANSCCSHPRVGETVLDAAYRRVREELGCEAVNLRELCAFAYRAEFDTGLCEHEYDHVLVGGVQGEVAPDLDEVDAVRWVSIEALAQELAEQPRHFSAWAPMVLSLGMKSILEHSANA